MNQRTLRAAPATIVCAIRDADGELTAPAGTVTVTITRDDGTIVATDRATTQAEDAEGEIVGLYTAGLTAAETADLDVLTCVWADDIDPRVTTQVEIVGGYYFSVADARAFDRSLASDGTYTDAGIRAARREVEDECERITRCAWVPRYGTGTAAVPCLGSKTAVLPVFAVRRLRSVTSVYGSIETELDVDGISVTEWGELRRASGFPGDRLEVAFEWGTDGPPSDLRHAALTRLRSRLNMENTAVPDRATSFSLQAGGVWTLAQPGRAGFDTGLPEVDAVYQRYSKKLPGIA